jgi:hypothetical protein
MKLSLDCDEFKKTYLEGKLAIDCLEITLTQNSAVNPRIYNLVGSLFINPENGVEARLVWERDSDYPYDQFAQLKAWGQIKPGDIFPEDHYFNLQALDTAGRIWRNPVVSLKRVEQERAEILMITCDFIQTELDSHVQRTLAHFVFHDEIGIRMNSAKSWKEPHRNGERHTTKQVAAKGLVNEFEIDYYPVATSKAGSAHELTAVAEPAASIDSHFDDRLLEAVQFSVARLAKPIMREVIRAGKQTITLSKFESLNNGLVQSAVPGHQHADFYRLMERYYQYACTEAKGEEAPPLSKIISGIFTLKGVWLDTIALLLAVTIESLLNEPAYKKLGAPDDKYCKEIDGLIANLKNIESLSQSLKTRAQNSLSNMKSSSASDRLHMLAKGDVVDQEDIKAWKFIRNKAAHGALTVDPSAVQCLLDRVNRLVVMAYKLVFFRISYQGLYTDYATRGRPEVPFDSEACKLKLEAFQKIT